MYEILKQICADNDYPFTYARSDFQNLFDEVEEKGVPHLFLDPITVSDNFSDMGVVEVKNYTGSFLLVVSSDLDEESYQYRFDNYIKPIINQAMEVIQEGIRCADVVTFDRWQVTEVINVFDYNFDGVAVQFSISIGQ